MSLLTIWLACYGVTFLLCDAKIIEAPRQWLTSRSTFLNELLNCYFCTGFWASLAVWFVVGELPANPSRYVESLVLNAFAGATFCYALNSLILTLESYHDRNNPQE